ncbi:MAG: hypothetical protein WCK09_00270 [Bacteroidota bacterium]
MKTELEITQDLLEIIAECEFRIHNARKAISVLTGIVYEDGPWNWDEKIKVANTDLFHAPVQDTQLPVPPPVTKQKEKQKRTFAEKNCENCGKPFMPTHNKQRFCRKECNPNVAKKQPTGKEIIEEMLELNHQPVAPEKHVDPVAFKAKMDQIRHDIPIQRERPNVTRGF